MPTLEMAPTPMVSRIDREFETWATSPAPQGNAGTLLMNEARRVKKGWPARSQLLQDYFEPPVPPLLPAATFEAGLRAYAESKGLDLDGMVASAGAHFRTDPVQRRVEPLTDEELESLFEDDQRTFGG